MGGLSEEDKVSGNPTLNSVIFRKSHGSFWLPPTNSSKPSSSYSPSSRKRMTRSNPPSAHSSPKSSSTLTTVNVRVSRAFNAIRDLENQKEIQEAIRSLESKLERETFIDRVLQRKKERNQAEELIRMSLVQPLIDRFARKLKQSIQITHESQELPVADLQQQPKTQPLQQTASVPSKYQQVSTYRQALLMNQQTPSISTFIQGNATDIRENSKKEQDNLVAAQSDSQSSDSPSANQQLALQSRAKIMLMLLRLRPDKAGGDDSIVGTSISNKGQSPLQQQQQQTLSRITQEMSKLINLGKVSEDSAALIEKGYVMQRERANQLLRQVQRESLSAHFKSHLLTSRLHQTPVNGDKYSAQRSFDLNTFSTDISPSTRRSNLKHRGAIKNVETDVKSFVEKYNSPDDEQRFLLSPKVFTGKQSRIIETTHKNTIIISPARIPLGLPENFSHAQKNWQQLQQKQTASTIQPRALTSRKSQRSLLNQNESIQAIELNRFALASTPHRGRAPRQAKSFSGFLTKKNSIEDETLFNKGNKEDSRLQEVEFGSNHSQVPLSSRKANRNFSQKSSFGNVKAAEQWKLDGLIRYDGTRNGKKSSEMEKDEFDDQSLVSITEIKLDKLYRQTKEINKSQQKSINRQVLDKHMLRLTCVRSDIHRTVQMKLNHKS